MSNLFLYSPPFTVPNNLSNTTSLMYDSLTGQERDDEKKIYELIFKFAANEGMVKPNGAELVIDPGEDVGSYLWIMTTMNFRSLIEKKQYGILMNSLQNSLTFPINRIIDLHYRLGSLFDTRLLNTIVNRVMTSVQIIPYDISPKEMFISWEQIHRETPFVWLCMLTQIVLRTEITKTRGE